MKQYVPEFENATVNKIVHIGPEEEDDVGAHDEGGQEQEEAGEDEEGDGDRSLFRASEERTSNAEQGEVQQDKGYVVEYFASHGYISVWGAQEDSSETEDGGYGHEDRGKEQTQMRATWVEPVDSCLALWLRENEGGEEKNHRQRSFQPL